MPLLSAPVKGGHTSHASQVWVGYPRLLNFRSTKVHSSLQRGARHAQTLGKITQYIESVSTSEMSASLRTQTELARSRVAVLEQELDPETVRERLDTFLNFIGRYMTDYSAQLDLEHRGSQLRLDIRSLTVMIT